MERRYFTISESKTKHPIGLRLVNISIALQSYAGYAVFSILILFFTADVSRNGLGMILTGIAFLTLILGISTLGGVTDGTKQMNILFIIVAYFLLTVGELCLSPIGMAMFNKLAPAKYGSLAMGAWYLSFFFSSIISGKLAGFTDTLGYTQIFGLISAIVIIFGVILILLRNGLLKLMSLDKFNN